MQLIWQGSFVEEANLSQTIFVLRKVLGADASGRPFIDTVPRRGYRFGADVRVVDAVENAVAVSRDRASRFRWLAGAAAVGLLVLIAGLWHRSLTPSASSDRKVMLAVLPFDNLSGDPEQQYFSNGLTEEMITQLGGLEPE